jgi:hypothetical protein
MLVGLCILNHEGVKDRKEKYFTKLDRVMDREEAAHLIIDSAVAIHPIQRTLLIAYFRLSMRSTCFLLN